MKAEEKALASVLTEQVRYEIPPYQRPYSWEEEQTLELMEDIGSAFDRQDKEYFIGSLVTIERERDAIYEVVDGQQRLTTLSIVLAQLQHQISDPAAKNEIGKRIMPVDALTGTAETPRLQVRRRDRDFYERHILKDNPLEIDGIDQEDSAKRNLLKNKLCVQRFLEGKDQVWLKKFAHYTINKVWVVFVKTDDLRSAHRLFNVLNARGLDLSNADLIKNTLFDLIADKEHAVEKLETLWDELESLIGIEQLDKFLGHYRTSVKADKAEKTLAEEYEDLIREEKLEPLTFMKKLVEAARFYDKIVGGRFTTNSALRSLTSLRRVGHDEWVPPLLAFLIAPNEEMGLKTYMELLERITIQNLVRRLGRAARNTVYYQLIRAINGGKANEKIRKIYKDAANNDEFAEFVAAEIYGTPSAKAILLGLEERQQDDSVVKQYDGRITIEHVLPQTMTDKYWTSRYTAKEHASWSNKLGNLTLLSGAGSSSKCNS